jgi:antitoxin component YwqK of YwqJK toxin-antitoxin module
MNEIKESYHINGELASISYYNSKGKLHREDDKPAELLYYKNGFLKSEKYMLNGKKHRSEGKPAFVKYNQEGKVIYLGYFINDKFHNIEKPALIKYHDNDQIEELKYYVNGIYKRNDVSLPCHLVYFKSGKLKTEEYFNNGKLHRDNDLPAFVSYYEDDNICSETYALNGIIARKKLDMPSSIAYEKGKVVYKKFCNECGDLFITDNYRYPVIYCRNPKETKYKFGKKTMNSIQYRDFLRIHMFTPEPTELKDEEIEMLKVIFY